MAANKTPYGTPKRSPRDGGTPVTTYGDAPPFKGFKRISDRHPLPGKLIIVLTSRANSVYFAYYCDVRREFKASIRRDAANYRVLPLGDNDLWCAAP